jgi:hypothetical protein
MMRHFPLWHHLNADAKISIAANFHRRTQGFDSAYLLLRALLNQQGDTGKVRELVQKLFAAFGTDLLLYPNTLEERFDQVLKVFREVGGERGAELYRVGALGGIKPLSLFLYRIAAFTIFIRNVRDSFYEAVKSKLDEGVRSLWEFLRDDPILDGGWVGNDPKAARMLTNWLAWLFSEVWQETEVDLQETLMIVDGHVGKEVTGVKGSVWVGFVSSMKAKRC